MFTTLAGLILVLGLFGAAYYIIYGQYQIGPSPIAQSQSINSQAVQSSSSASSVASLSNGRQGRLERLSYQANYRGRSYKKNALVYLPANYSKKKRYNVVYLLHGSTETPDDFYRDGNFQKVIARLQANGNLKKNTIVIFPTYYPNRSFVKSDYYQDDVLNRAFAKNELVNSLVPAVESHYSTYAQGTSKLALRRSRSHRAFGGFSMGSITTWYVFQYQLPYFAYYLPMAGDSWGVTSDGGASASRQTAKLLGQAAASNLSFKILSGVGSNDGTLASMDPQIRAMWRLPQFSRKNLQYYQHPGGTHSPQTIAAIFSHYANQLFK